MQEYLEKKGDKVYLHGIDISLKDPEKSVNVVKVNLKPLKQKGVIEKFYKDEIVLEFPDPTRDFYFKGIDEEGNIYFLCKLVYPERVHSPEYEMTKYDLTGKLLTVIKMRDGLELKGHWIPYLTMIVDSNGNIYDIFGSEENVYVIKWLKE